MDAAIGRLEDSAGGCADVIDQRTTRNAGNRSGAIANRADVAKLELAVDIRIDGWLLCSKGINRDPQ